MPILRTTTAFLYRIDTSGESTPSTLFQTTGDRESKTSIERQVLAVAAAPGGVYFRR